MTHLILAGVAALSVYNGMHSPMLLWLFGLQGFWYPSFLPPGFAWTQAATIVVMTLAYLIVSGIPAALFERLTLKTEVTLTSRLIWLATIIAMTVPIYS
jgi:hypothetical protein